jgi:ADP-heptose:LPS heptosyltransferase
VTNKIHGNKDCRRWDMKNRTELSNELIKKWYVVLLLWINSDRELHINNNNFYNLLGKYNIIETIYLINNIDFLVTCDNGIMHFGWCTETKIVALFWPTDPRYKFPFINKNTNQPIGWIWKEERQCYDCYGRYDKCNGNEINKITVRDVLNKIK